MREFEAAPRRGRRDDNINSGDTGIGKRRKRDDNTREARGGPKKIGSERRGTVSKRKRKREIKFLNGGISARPVIP